jgi:hypothetical protein
MALPPEQVASLRDGIEAHTQRITELREWIKLAEEEISLHEALRDFVGDERLGAALGEVFDKPALTSELARDPLRYCREKDVVLPEGLTLAAVETRAEPSTRLTAHLTYGAWDVEAVWDSEAGFFARPRRTGLGDGRVSLMTPSRGR